MTKIENINCNKDPAISATIADLKGRWPAIGAAADHPLTEFFVARNPAARKSFKRKQLLFLLIPTLVILILIGQRVGPFSSILRNIMQYNGFIIALVFVSIALHRKFAEPAKARNLLTPIQMFANPGNVSQWEHLWLAPLTFYDLVGICVGERYHAKLTHKGWPWRWIFRIAIWLAMAALVLVFYKNRPLFITIITVNGYLPQAIMVTASVAFFVYALRTLRLNPVLNMLNSMNAINTIILQHQKTLFAGLKTFRRQWPFVAWGCMFQANLMIVMIAGMNGANVWFLLSGSLVVWGVAFLAISKSLARMDMDARFNEFIETESKEFDILINQIIGRGGTE